MASPDEATPREKGHLSTLKSEEAAFGAIVDYVAENIGKLRAGHVERMMTTPLVLLLAEESRNALHSGKPERQTADVKIRDIMLTHSVIEKMLVTHELKLDDVKTLPRLLSDPIMVLDSSPFSVAATRKQIPNALVVMVEITDVKKATVIVPINLEESFRNRATPGIYNIVTSAYGRRFKDMLTPNNQWFADEVNSGRALYINTQKISKWLLGSHLLLASATTIRRLNPSLKIESDLVKLIEDKNSERDTGGAKRDKLAEARQIAKQRLGEGAVLTSAQPDRTYIGTIIGVLGDPLNAAVMAVPGGHAILHDLKDASEKNALAPGEMVRLVTDGQGYSSAQDRSAEEQSHRLNQEVKR